MDILKAKNGVNEQQFMHILKSATRIARKRGDIPQNSNFAANLKSASKVIMNNF